MQVVLRDVEFLGEQDGVPERKLKAAFNNFFEKEPSITKAFLAVIRYGGGQRNVHVALCISAENGGAKESIVYNCGQIFSFLFGNHEHLDILFLDDDASRRISETCPPFYGKA